MSCEEAERALNARLDGRPFDAAALDAHLTGCAACRSIAEDFADMRSAFSMARDAWRPARSLVPRFSQPWRRWVVAAAMLFITLGIWAFTLVHSEPGANLTVETVSVEESRDTQLTNLMLEE